MPEYAQELVSEGVDGDGKGRGSEEETERAPQHPLQDGRGVGHGGSSGLAVRTELSVRRFFRLGCFPPRLFLACIVSH